MCSGAAMTEAHLYRDAEVFVIGGANSAGQAALHLAQKARQVTLVVRGDSLANAMSAYLIEPIRARTAAPTPVPGRTDARCTSSTSPKVG